MDDLSLIRREMAKKVIDTLSNEELTRVLESMGASGRLSEDPTGGEPGSIYDIRRKLRESTSTVEPGVTQGVPSGSVWAVQNKNPAPYGPLPKTTAAPQQPEYPAPQSLIDKVNSLTLK